MTAVYRPNVAVMIVNPTGQIWLGHRATLAADAPYGFQCPQGGIDTDESPETAAFRELCEETGLTRDKVTFIAQSAQSYTYDIPPELRRNTPLKWTGQTQRWFLVLFTGTDADFKLDDFPQEIEFDRFKWVEPDAVLPQIVPFKRGVYERVLAEFMPHIDRIKSQTPIGG